MTQLGEPQASPGAVAGWRVDLTRGVAQVLDAHGRSAGTGFVVGERLLVTCAHVVAGGSSSEPPADPVTVRFTHLSDATWIALVDPQLWRAPDSGDIAFLRLDGPVPAQPLVLGGSTGVRGHRV